MNTSPSKYSSNTKGGGDSKDLIINQLKREIMELRVNERDLGAMNTQLSGLEQKYRMLQDDKAQMEQDHRNKSDKNLRSMAQMRTELDSLKRQNEEKNGEYDALLNDLGELETLQSFKEQQLENNRAEEAEAVDMRQRAEEELTAAKRRLDKLISERAHMFSKKERDHAKLEEMNYQERDNSEKINATEDDLVGKKRLHEQIEAEIDLNGKNEQAINEASNPTLV